MCIMTEFFNVTSVQEALNLILQKLIPNNQSEFVKKSTQEREIVVGHFTLK